MQRKRIAVIGAGISGLTSAYLLSRHHDVDLFEANDYPGGHTHTVDVREHGATHALDTGFLVFNDRNYPHFTRLLDELKVARQSTSMSFSVQCEKSGLEYCGSSLGGLFAQRRNLARPAFYRMLFDIYRFGKEARVLLNENASEITLGAYLNQNRYSYEFEHHYLIPMTAALWSADPTHIDEFPANYLVQFLDHHGMLGLGNRPNWFVVQGGSRQYVDRMLADSDLRLHLNAPVTSLSRLDPGVQLEARGHEPVTFDIVVVAVHSNQALDLLADASDQEKEILGAIPYQSNDVMLHKDPSLLPHERRAWASWNYRVPEKPRQRVDVTYHLNQLQSIRGDTVFNVSLNRTEDVAPGHRLEQFTYDHPVYTMATRNAQQRHQLISGQRNTYYCGAYWGHGFHEDGVKSALDVTRQLGLVW